MATGGNISYIPFEYTGLGGLAKSLGDFNDFYSKKQEADRQYLLQEQQLELQREQLEESRQQFAKNYILDSGTFLNLETGEQRHRFLAENGAILEGLDYEMGPQEKLAQVDARIELRTNEFAEAIQAGLEDTLTDQQLMLGQARLFQDANADLTRQEGTFRVAALERNEIQDLAFAQWAQDNNYGNLSQEQILTIDGLQTSGLQRDVWELQMSETRLAMRRMQQEYEQLELINPLLVERLQGDIKLQANALLESLPPEFRDKASEFYEISLEFARDPLHEITYESIPTVDDYARWFNEGTTGNEAKDKAISLIANERSDRFVADRDAAVHKLGQETMTALANAVMALPEGMVDRESIYKVVRDAINVLAVDAGFIAELGEAKKWWQGGNGPRLSIEQWDAVVDQVGFEAGVFPDYASPGLPDGNSGGGPRLQRETQLSADRHIEAAGSPEEALTDIISDYAWLLENQKYEKTELDAVRDYLSEIVAVRARERNEAETGVTPEGAATEGGSSPGGTKEVPWEGEPALWSESWGENPFGPGSLNMPYSAGEMIFRATGQMASDVLGTAGQLGGYAIDALQRLENVDRAISEGIDRSAGEAINLLLEQSAANTTRMSVEAQAAFNRLPRTTPMSMPANAPANRPANTPFSVSPNPVSPAAEQAIVRYSQTVNDWKNTAATHIRDNAEHIQNAASRGIAAMVTAIESEVERLPMSMPANVSANPIAGGQATVNEIRELHEYTNTVVGTMEALISAPRGQALRSRLNQINRLVEQYVTTYTNTQSFPSGSGENALANLQVEINQLGGRIPVQVDGVWYR